MKDEMSASDRCLASRGRAVPFTKDRLRKHPLSRFFPLFFCSRVIFVPRPSTFVSASYSGSYAAFSRFMYPIITLPGLEPPHPDASSLFVPSYHSYRPYLSYQLPYLWRLLSDDKTLQVTRREWNAIIRRRQDRALPVGNFHHHRLIN